MNIPTLTPNVDPSADLQKIGTISVPVPIHKPGNNVGHLLTFFDVYSNGTDFKAVPLCSPYHKSLANLPEAITFQVTEGHVAGVRSRCREVVADIVGELRKSGLVA